MIEFIERFLIDLNIYTKSREQLTKKVYELELEGRTEIERCKGEVHA